MAKGMMVLRLICIDFLDIGFPASITSIIHEPKWPTGTFIFFVTRKFRFDTNVTAKVLKFC